MVDVLAYLVFLGELDALATLAVLKRSGFCNGVLTYFLGYGLHFVSVVVSCS